MGTWIITRILLHVYLTRMDRCVYGECGECGVGLLAIEVPSGDNVPSLRVCGNTVLSHVYFCMLEIVKQECTHVYMRRVVFGGVIIRP